MNKHHKTVTPLLQVLNEPFPTRPGTSAQASDNA